VERIGRENLQTARRRGSGLGSIDEVAATQARLELGPLVGSMEAPMGPQALAEAEAPVGSGTVVEAVEARVETGAPVEAMEALVEAAEARFAIVTISTPRQCTCPILALVQRRDELCI
jgi:hypothetical protein